MSVIKNTVLSAKLLYDDCRQVEGVHYNEPGKSSFMMERPVRTSPRVQRQGYGPALLKDLARINLEKAKSFTGRPLELHCV